MNKIVMYVIVAPIALLSWYGAKEMAHMQNIETALEMQCKSVNGFKSVEKVDVPWYSPFSNGEYPCAAKLKLTTNDGERFLDVVFVAKKVSSVDAVADVAKVASGKDVADDWEVNMGFWGWIGDDYRIRNLKAK